MKTSQIKPETYCVGCRNCIEFRCEILGAVDLEKMKVCNRAGYREIKYTNSSVRHYQNRQAPYESEAR